MNATNVWIGELRGWEETKLNSETSADMPCPREVPCLQVVACSERVAAKASTPTLAPMLVAEKMGAAATITKQ